MGKHGNTMDKMNAFSRESMNQGSYGEAPSSWEQSNPQQPLQNPEKWICPNDETVNTGDICIICGCPHPGKIEEKKEANKQSPASPPQQPPKDSTAPAPRKRKALSILTVAVIFIFIFLGGFYISKSSNSLAPTISAETNLITMKKGTEEPVVLTLSGDIPDGFGLWMQWSGPVFAEWVDWGKNSGKYGPITIHAKEEGTGQVIVHLVDKENNDIDTTIIQVNVVS